MTLRDIGYMLLEALRANYISDDEKVDIRLLHAWVNLKRAEFIKKNRNNNPNWRTNLNLYQVQTVTMNINDVEDAGDYPYSNSSTQLYEIIQSTTTIPSIMEDKNGLMILSLESEDLMKLPFSVVDYDYLRFAGNGKFNTNLIFGSVRDNYVYFKYNEFFEEYDTVKLRAIFEDPTLVTGFDVDTSTYPITNEIMEYVKNALYSIDFKMILGTNSDLVNNANGEVQQ